MEILVTASTQEMAQEWGSRVATCGVRARVFCATITKGQMLQRSVALDLVVAVTPPGADGFEVHFLDLLAELRCPLLVLMETPFALPGFPHTYTVALPIGQSLLRRCIEEFAFTKVGISPSDPVS